MSDAWVVNDQVREFLRSHADVEYKLRVCSQSSAEIFSFFVFKWHFYCLIQVLFDLRVVELLTHVEIPVWLRQHSWNQPNRTQLIVQPSLLWIRFFNWKGCQKRGNEVVRKELVIFNIWGWYSTLGRTILFLVVLISQNSRYCKLLHVSELRHSLLMNVYIVLDVHDGGIDRILVLFNFSDVFIYFHLAHLFSKSELPNCLLSGLKPGNL